MEEDGKCPLHCVQLMLDKGADINAETRNGHSLLLCAIKSHDTALAELLLSREAKCQDGEVNPIQAAIHYDNPPDTGIIPLLRKYGYKE